MEMYIQISEKHKYSYIRNKKKTFQKFWIKHVLIVINKITATFHNPRQRHPHLLDYPKDMR